MRNKVLGGVVLLAACTASLAHAASIAPAFSGSYTLHDLGPISGLPPAYGGLTFAAGDPNTLIIGGEANTSDGLFYSVPVIRGVDNHITGFGAATPLGFGAFNDGGVTYGPGGVLFYSRWPENELGQVKPGSATDDKIIDLGALGVAESHASLGFVPAGFDGAGSLKLSSWAGGEFYDATLVADGSGTYDVTSIVQTATLPGGPEGFIWVPIGSPLFGTQSMLVSEFSAGFVAAYEIDGDGNPIVATRQDFVVDLTGAEGAVIDPLTGDFLFSTFGTAEDRVIRVEGFVPPPPEVPEPGTVGLMLAGLAALAIGAQRKRSVSK